MTPEQAWSRLEEHLPPRVPQAGSVWVERRDLVGRVLAEDLIATVDVPGTDVSAMDGYAYAGEVEPDATMPVLATIAAGDPPGVELPTGQAARIMTGATVPPGADRVIPVERTRLADPLDGTERVVVESPVGAEANIRWRAEVLAVGDPLLPSGTRLTPGALALIATHGFREAPVNRRPTVSTLTTGDEVVPPERTPAPGQLRDSHTDFLLSAGRTLGYRFESLGIAPDDPERLADQIRRGLDSTVLLIGGGVSMGEFDLVEDVLASQGCEILFEHVSIQPGKPLVAARHDRGLVFGLPGNPAAVMACFWLFVRPVLRRLEGIDDSFWHGALTGELIDRLPGAKARDRFLPAAVATREGKVLVRPLPPKGSHDLAAYGRGSALVRIPANAAPAEAGDACEVLPLADWPGDPLG